MKIRHISASSAQETRNDQFPIRRIYYNQYVTPRKLTPIRHIHLSIYGAKSPGWLSITACLRMKYRLSLKNDMPLRDKIIIALINQPAIWYDEYVHDLRSIETKFLAIIFNDNLTSNETLSCEPTVSSLNDNEIDFRTSFDESNDEDYTVVYDENLFSYKIISVNNLKTDSENDNEKVNMPSFLSPEPEVNYFNDLDFFKDFENEFPAIVYNDALTSKSDLLTEPTISPRHIDEFDLKDETSLSECDEKEQNILYFNDLLSFNVIYPDDLKSDTDDDNDKIDIE
ncbi:hypothetical protein Tco_0563716 [Tanacetum coccineum]